MNILQEYFRALDVDGVFSASSTFRVSKQQQNQQHPYEAVVEMNLSSYYASNNLLF